QTSFDSKNLESGDPIVSGGEKMETGTGQAPPNHEDINVGPAPVTKFSNAQRQCQQLPASLDREIDNCCDAFESAWRAGRPVPLEHYLDRVTAPARPELLRELLGLEIDYRSRRGDTPFPEEYRRRFPEHTGQVDEVFQSLARPLKRPQSLLARWTI